MRSTAFFVLLWVFVLAGFARAAPEVTEFTLDNGMDVVVIEDHRTPVVTHMVWYRVGAADESPGKSGIAHFLEHLLFKGTDEIPDGAFSQIIAANGGTDNAFTSLDYTAYFQRIAVDRLDLVMKMEADRMVDLVITEDHIRTERDVILEERASRTDNSPGALFGEQMTAALYLNHPYGIPVIGWRHEMETLSRDDALAFYDRYYAPDNAILVVAGDVEPEEVRRLAEIHYGPLKPSGRPPAPRVTEPPHLAPRRLQMSDPRVRQPYVTRRYLVPQYRSDDPGPAAALTVLSAILGNGVASRFSQAIELDQKIAIDTGAFYTARSRDMSSFGIYAVPAPGVSLEEVEAALDEVLAEMIDTGPTEEELARVKRLLRAAIVFAQDSQMSLAQQYGVAFALGLGVEDVTGWPDIVDAVTAEDVRTAAAEYLQIAGSVTGWLLSEEETQ